MAIGNNIESRPAGKNDKIDIDVISLVQIVEKDEKSKTLVTNSKRVEGILSTDLDLGVSIKVENGGRQQEDMTK